jgi:hypothetical protein
MEYAFGILGIVICVIMMIMAANNSWKRAMKRLQALHDIARRLKLHHIGGIDNSILETYAASDLCGKGHSKEASNIIWGDFGAGKVCYFDYSYTVGSGRSQSTHYCCACAFHGLCVWRRLLVRPEDFGDKAAGFLGFEDINLDNAEFNRKFFVKSEDKKFAYDVLSQRAMEFFLAHPGLTMEMQADYTLLYRSGTLSPDHVERLILDSAAFFDLVPDYVREDKREMPARPLSPPAGVHGQAAPGHTDNVPPTGSVADKPADRRRPEAQS